MAILSTFLFTTIVISSSTLPPLATTGQIHISLPERAAGVVVPLVEQQAAAADDFKALSDAFDAVWGKWRDEHIAAMRAEASEEELAAVKAKDPTSQYIAQFQDGAKRHAGTKQAIPYLQWLFGRALQADAQAARDALDQLMRDHADDRATMDRLAMSIAIKAERFGFDRRKSLDVLDTIADNAGATELRATALYWRCYVLAETRSTEQEMARAIEDLATAAKLGNARISPMAENMRFELQNLRIGCVAPDIEGVDADGVSFKLSDYRGQVVILDFWGFW